MHQECTENAPKMHPFLTWLFREYRKPELLFHPSSQLLLEIEAKWIRDFPTEGGYLELALFLADHGACMKCKKAFRDAWENYIADAK